MSTSNDSETLGEMSHTNLYTGRVFGETQAYARGKAVAADGGSVSASDGSETLAAVSHTPVEVSDETQSAFNRGVVTKHE